MLTLICDAEKTCYNGQITGDAKTIFLSKWLGPYLRNRYQHAGTHTVCADPCTARVQQESVLGPLILQSSLHQS